jgi:hypothetical protein
MKMPNLLGEEKKKSIPKKKEIIIIFLGNFLIHTFFG